jgi:hypothetical protein
VEKVAWEERVASEEMEVQKVMHAPPVNKDHWVPEEIQETQENLEKKVISLLNFV